MCNNSAAGVCQHAALRKRQAVCQNPAVQHDGDFAPAGRVRAIAYRLLWSLAHAFQRGGHACIYAAAGLLRKDDFRTASRLLWRNYGTSIEDIDGGLEVWERRLYDARPETVGPHPARRLRRRTGFAGPSRDGVRGHRARSDAGAGRPGPANLARRGVTAIIREGFIETSDLEEPYDVVVLAGNCYSFLLTAASRIATLARIKAHLSPQGRVVIMYTGTHRPPVAIHVARITSRIARADWRPEPGDAFARDPVTRRLLRYEHMFMPGEVERECAEAGLRVVRDVRTAGYLRGRRSGRVAILRTLQPGRVGQRPQAGHRRRPEEPRDGENISDAAPARWPSGASRMRTGSQTSHARERPD